VDWLGIGIARLTSRIQRGKSGQFLRYARGEISDEEFARIKRGLS